MSCMDWHCIQHKSFWWFLATFWVRTLVSFSYHMWPMNFETKQHEIHYIRTVPTFQSFWGSHLGDSSNEISARRFLLRQVLLWGFLLCHFCKNLVSLIFGKVGSCLQGFLVRVESLEHFTNVNSKQSIDISDEPCLLGSEYYY